MIKSVRSKADKTFAASEKKADRLIAEKVQAREARLKKTERLKALRLSKVDSDNTED